VADFELSRCTCDSVSFQKACRIAAFKRCEKAMESAIHWKNASRIGLTGKVPPITWSSEVEQPAWPILAQIYVRIERFYWLPRYRFQYLDQSNDAHDGINCQKASAAQRNSDYGSIVAQDIIIIDKTLTQNLFLHVLTRSPRRHPT
jgi:hypothetical protein